MYSRIQGLQILDTGYCRQYDTCDTGTGYLLNTVKIRRQEIQLLDTGYSVQ